MPSSTKPIGGEKKKLQPTKSLEDKLKEAREREDKRQLKKKLTKKEQEEYRKEALIRAKQKLDKAIEKIVKAEEKIVKLEEAAYLESIGRLEQEEIPPRKFMERWGKEVVEAKMKAKEEREKLRAAKRMPETFGTDKWETGKELIKRWKKERGIPEDEVMEPEYEVAEEIAEEAEMDIREVYTLFFSPEI
jgi:hypothetical protein